MIVECAFDWNKSTSCTAPYLCITELNSVYNFMAVTIY